MQGTDKREERREATLPQSPQTATFFSFHFSLLSISRGLVGKPQGLQKPLENVILLAWGICILGLTMKPRELIRFLESNGYSFVRSKGTSHHIYSNGNHSVPVPIHGSKDFGEDFISMILRETGISKKDLLKYLGR